MNTFSTENAFTEPAATFVPPPVPHPPTLLPDAAPGRPSTCSPDKVHAMATLIRLTGVSDTAAAAMAGVTRSTLSRWKQHDERVEMLLEAARTHYQIPRLQKIGEQRLKDGQLDWRAQAWLIKFAAPEVHGRPSPRRRLGDVEVEAEPPVTGERVAASPETAEPERAAGEAATLESTEDEQAAGEAAPTPAEPEAEPPKSVTFRPEIVSELVATSLPSTDGAVPSSREHESA